MEKISKEKSGVGVQYMFVYRPKRFILWATYNDIMIDDDSDNGDDEDGEEDMLQ